MKPVSDDLLAFLASNREYVKVDAITFYLVGGTDEIYRLRYTSGQTDLTTQPLDGDVISRTWLSNVVLVKGLRAKQSIGMDVDEQSIALNPVGDAMALGVPFMQAITDGVFDGAFVRRDRFYFDAETPFAAPVGGVPMFYGRVSTFDQVGRTDATLKVKSGMVTLNRQMPRDLFQPTCLNRVYDAACALDPAAFAVNGTVGAGATTTHVPSTDSDAGLAQGRVFFADLGTVGVWRAIKSADSSGFDLAYPLPAPPVSGLAFTAYPGCDRTFARCGEFSNTARFRGTRFIPQPEKAI